MTVLCWRRSAAARWSSRTVSCAATTAVGRPTSTTATNLPKPHRPLPPRPSARVRKRASATVPARSRERRPARPGGWRRRSRRPKPSWPRSRRTSPTPPPGQHRPRWSSPKSATRQRKTSWPNSMRAGRRPSARSAQRAIQPDHGALARGEGDVADLCLLRLGVGSAEVGAPDDLAQDDPHLIFGKGSADAAPHAAAEGDPGVVVGLALEEALGAELLGLGEEVLAVVQGGDRR